MARDSARGNVLFTDEELNEIAGVKKGEDFVEVTCGCTSPRYGDAVGRLRVFASGKLEVACECTPGCREDKLTPAAFEKHTGRESQRRWKYYVWVIVKGKKIPLLKTALLKYHEKMHGGSSHRGNKGRPFHRDEFVRCSRCNRERRFHLQTKVECRTYHDAVLDANWKCSDLPADELPIVVARRPVHCHSSQPSLLFYAIIPAFFAVVILAQELARALKLRFAIEVMTSSLLFVIVRPPSSDAIILAV